MWRGGQERAWGGRSLGLRHTHLLLSPFLNTPAHEALRTHPHGTTGMPAPGEIVFAAKLGCVNYSDNEFARCIRAGPPPAPHSAPSPVSLWSQPPPAPRPSRPCWQPLSQPLSRLIGSQMYFKYHSVQRQLLKTLSSHCRWARVASSFLTLCRAMPPAPPHPARPDPSLSLSALASAGPDL